MALIPNEVEASWLKVYDSFPVSGKQFYEMVLTEMQAMKIHSLNWHPIRVPKGTFGSGTREMLRCKWQHYTFDIGAGTFGGAFFVFWVLGKQTNYFEYFVAATPFFGTLLHRLIFPKNYEQSIYRSIFKETAHQAIVKVLDNLSSQETSVPQLDVKERQIPDVPQPFIIPPANDALPT